MMQSISLTTDQAQVQANSFVGSTAYDTQKLKSMALTRPVSLNPGVVRKGAILGALSLHLDFINLFLMLLMIFGSSRD